MIDTLATLIFWGCTHKLTLAALVLAFIAGTAWESWIEFKDNEKKAQQRATLASDAAGPDQYHQK